jgi:hypothetical protein
VRALAILAISAVGLFAPQRSEAQALAPRVLIDVGAARIGGGSLGSRDATYTTPAGDPFTLFSTSQSWSAGTGVIGHVLVRITPRVAAELSGSWTRPELRSTITADFEGIGNTTASQSVSQFLTSGGLVMSLRQRGKWTPFARGAIGWLRHLTNDQTLYDDGISAEIGGGVKYTWAEKHGHFRPYGLRADVWMNLRTGGIEAAPKSRVIAPGLALSLMFKL